MPGKAQKLAAGADEPIHQSQCRRLHTRAYRLWWCRTGCQDGRWGWCNQQQLQRGNSTLVDSRLQFKDNTGILAWPAAAFLGTNVHHLAIIAEYNPLERIEGAFDKVVGVRNVQEPFP